MKYPILGYDESNIFCEDAPDQKMEIPFSEIVKISGYKLDCIESVKTVLEVEHESGHFMEFYDDWIGFELVVSEITKRFNLHSNWLSSLGDLDVKADPITVWQREK